ncbi:MAG: hypothetical protein ABFS08_09280 [Pseudomonadota bacterium]
MAASAADHTVKQWQRVGVGRDRPHVDNVLALFNPILMTVDAELRQGGANRRHYRLVIVYPLSVAVGALTVVNRE